MSKAGDIRRAAEALPRYDLWDACMEESPDGDWLRREDVLTLFPPTPLIVYHSDPPKAPAPGGYSHPKVTPKLKGVAS